MYVYVVINVMFSQSIYSVTKDSGSVQLSLVLSKPSSTTFTVEVSNTCTDGFATGEYNI